MIDLKLRTKDFALQVIKTLQPIPFSTTTSILSRQLIRSATSVGANYRSALRAKSKADFIAKLAIAQEEADESCYWIDLIIDLNIADPEKSKFLFKEANELTAILSASSKTAKSNKSPRTSYLSPRTSHLHKKAPLWKQRDFS
jgi:four helix bundle protein